MRWGIGAALIVGLVGCAGGGANLQGVGPDALYERGVQELEAERWAEAVRVFEQIIVAHPGDPRTEEIRYLLGLAHFGKRDYVTAASEFVRLVNDYPMGEYAEKARFKTCEAYYTLSPRPQLDQEYTRAAMDHCGTLLDVFPTGEFAEQTRALLADLNDKLAEKTFLSGRYYMKRRAYESAIIYFDEVLRRYPGSSFTPRAMLGLVEVYHTLGDREQMEQIRTRLAREFPGSEEARKAEEFALANGR